MEKPKLNHGSLFSGIGGFDLASQWMGWKNVFHCEWNPFCQQILKYHFPKSVSYEDITKTDFSIYRGQIDILSGGFPCQPYSTAGKRLGKEDDRHLWPEMLRAVREIQPSWVVAENVRGIVSWNEGLAFKEVHVGLEAQGYEVQSFILPAAGVNAPHRRDRVWFLAYANDKRRSSKLGGIQKANGKVSKRNENSQSSNTGQSNATYSSGARSRNDLRNKQKWEKVDKRQERKSQSKFGENGINENAPNSCGVGCGRRDIGSKANKVHGDKVGSSIRQNGNRVRSENEGCGPYATNSNIKRPQRRQDRHESKKRSKSNDEQFVRCYKLDGKKWENFPTQSPVCGGNDGLPRELDGITISKWRKESIKAYGNAIVPQVALQIFKAISSYMKNINQDE